MHAPTALQFTVHRFGVWRALLAALALGVAAVFAAWVWGSSWSILGTAACSAAGLCALWALASLARCTPATLRWDTQQWHVGPAGVRAEAMLPCELQLALDLGDWMLLRLQPAAGRPWETRWLPVQRRGHETFWHALRCTVHSARTDLAGPWAAALGGAPLP